MKKLTQKQIDDLYEIALCCEGCEYERESKRILGVKYE